MQSLQFCKVFIWWKVIGNIKMTRKQFNLDNENIQSRNDGLI